MEPTTVTEMFKSAETTCVNASLATLTIATMVRLVWNELRPKKKAEEHHGHKKPHSGRHPQA